MALSGAGNPDHIAELFGGFGPVVVRRMFGGSGVFADGLMIGLVVDGVIFLKADAESAADFEREGLCPFSYRTKRGMRTLNTYWRMPERLYDDPDALAGWARRALAAARRTGAKTSKRSRP